MATDRAALSRRGFLGMAGAGLAAAGLVACGLDNGAAPDLRDQPSKARFGGELQAPPLAKPDVTFTDMYGKPFPFREKTAGKLAILFFGYTSCPDVCPIFLQTLSRATAAIGDGPGSDPMVLFVGVDVARDTPEKLQTYLKAFDARFLGLTGTEKVIAKANEQMLMPPIVIEEPDKDGNYQVIHYAKVFPFTPDDVAHRIYPPDVRQSTLVDDLPRLAQGTYK